MTRNTKEIGGLILVMALVFVLWSYPVLYPLKLLVVFFHESSHAIMTVLTGGQVKELMLDPRQGGHVLSLGGDRFWTLTAGYLGSLLWGIVIYLLAVHTKLDKALMAMLGIGIVGMAVIFSGESFALTFSVIVGAVMVASAWLVPMEVNDLVLRLIGMTNMMYAPLDIYSDTIQRSHLRSDAFMLAEEFGGTAIMWGSVWIAVSALLLFMTVWLSLRGGKKTQ